MVEPFRERRHDHTVTCAAVLSGTTWSVGVPESRQTEHLRSYVPGENRWEVYYATLAPGRLDLAQQVVTDVHQALSVHGDQRWPVDTTVRLEVTGGRRDYSNSEETAVSFAIEKWELSLTHRSGASLRRLTDHSRKLSYLVDYLTAQWRWPETPTRNERNVPEGGAPVLLASSAAGVLIHELVGHALEEGDVWPGQQLLPAGVHVTAEAASLTGVDDEGVPTKTRRVIGDGNVLLTVRDRMSTMDTCGPPTGHAVASPHAPMPRLRLPNLHMCADEEVQETSLPEHFIRCTAVRGARYFHGQAVLDVARAELVTQSGTAPLPPFRLAVGHHELRDLVVITHQGRPEVTPPGLCIKHGEPLSSMVTCPPLLLHQTHLLRSSV